jgi:hypothetical protein
MRWRSAGERDHDMPTTPYATVLCSVNGDTAVTGARTLVGGETVQLSGQDTAFWTSQKWELYDYPTGFAVPAGWTDVSGVYTSTATTPPSFSVDRLRDRMGKYAVRLTVNNGLKNGVSDSDMVDEDFAILVKGASGLESVAEMETNQFGTSWAESLKRDLATIERNVGHSGKHVATTNATVTNIATYAMATNSRLYVLRCSVLAVGDTLAQSALYDVTIAYSRDSGGTLTNRVASVTVVYETTAGFNVTQANVGDNLELRVTGAAATNLRWHVMNERFWTLPY